MKILFCYLLITLLWGGALVWGTGHHYGMW